MLHSAEEFKKTVTNLVDDFESNGPFTPHVSVANALEFVSGMHQQLNQLKTQEESIRRGLNIFKIDQPPSNVIVALEKVVYIYCDTCMCACIHMYVCACIILCLYTGSWIKCTYNMLFICRI